MQRFENESGLEKRASWPYVHSSHLMQRKFWDANSWCKRAGLPQACPWKGEVQGQQMFWLWVRIAVSRIIWVLFGIGLFPTKLSQFSQFSHWLFNHIQSSWLIQADDSDYICVRTCAGFCWILLVDTCASSPRS